MASSGVQVPDWLTSAFPGRVWQSLKICSINVAKDGSGAGLDLEATECGYHVETVDGEPGQPEELRAGVMIIAIDGQPLLGLAEGALEETFGAYFADKVAVTVVDGVELRRAIVERDSREECPCEEVTDSVDDAAEVAMEVEEDEVLEHGSVVRVPLRNTAGAALAPETRESLAQDLATFSERAAVRAELNDLCIVLCGEPEDLRHARAELGDLIGFYGLGPAASQEPMEIVEVEGLVMQSLPARNRRQRKAGSDGQKDNFGAVDDDGRSAAGPREGGAGKPPAELPTAVARAHPDDRRQYEYLDHTADVILHSWGRTMAEAFEQNVVCFFSYMTELDTVDLVSTVEVEATGHDMPDLMYHLLDEFLFSFGTELIVCRKVEVLEFDLENFRVKARGTGERFDLKKHPQGTEIKAITMHQLKILTPDTLTTEKGTVPRMNAQVGTSDGTHHEGFPFECYVLVDI